MMALLIPLLTVQQTGYMKKNLVLQSMVWSPNGDRIAFYRFDEKHVKEFTMELWGGLYPDQVRFKYPKAGEQNAIVSIHVYDLSTGETKMMDIGRNQINIFHALIGVKIMIYFLFVE